MIYSFDWFFFFIFIKPKLKRKIFSRIMINVYLLRNIVLIQRKYVALHYLLYINLVETFCFLMLKNPFLYIWRIKKLINIFKHKKTQICYDFLNLHISLYQNINQIMQYNIISLLIYSKIEAHTNSNRIINKV